jgi:glycosyltransferase involved in cell wall biosynthesis
MSKRLLLISSNSSGRGGGERYLAYLTQGLHLFNCEVHVLLSTVDYMNDWSNTFSAEGAIVHRRELVGLRHRPLRFIQSMIDKKQQLLIANVCQEIAPDAILVNQQYDEDGLDYLAGALMSKVAPVGGIIHMPMVATKHQRPLGTIRGKILNHWYKNHAYRLILVSEGSQKEFETYYLHPRPTYVVHHGYSFARSVPSKISNSKRNLPEAWSGEIPTIGFVGQLVNQKNLDLLIEAWNWLRQKGIPVYLLLVGDGPEKARLQAKLSRVASPHEWHITGWQANPEDYLVCIDVYTMTSHFEGLPLALIEAVGNGLPSVISDFNGAADVAKIAPWVTVVKEHTPEAVGQALMTAIQNIDYLKNQAERGKQNFQNYFSLKRMAAETLAVLSVSSEN